MNVKKYLSLAIIAFCSALLACDEMAAVVINDPDARNALTCMLIPSFSGVDCTDADVQNKVVSVLSDGAVSAEINCNGVAIGTTGFAFVAHYKAQRLQDGSCNAKVDLFTAAPPTPGTVQSSATELTRRSEADADFCPVTSFRVAAQRFTTWVEAGVIRVEGPGCTTTPGTACTMPVVGSCSGDLGEF